MKNIAIFGNDRQEQHILQLKAFLRELPLHFEKIYIESSFSSYLGEIGVSVEKMEPTTDVPGDAECIVSIGGDGTFLRAAAWQGKRELPILGINTGHLGFLASHSLEEADEVISEIACDSGVVEPRMLLEVSSPDMPEGMWQYVLNEVSVVKGDTTSMVSVRAFIDGDFLADYLADGLVICTPTGSTAYNLSAGGPIMQPTLQCMALTPIAAHSLTMRPVVIDADSEVRLCVSSRGEQCHVGIDGRMFSLPGSGGAVAVRRAPFSVNVMRSSRSDFATVMRNKLLWGRR